MLKDKTLIAALFISGLGHGAFVMQNPGFITFSNTAKNQKIEVSYIKKRQVIEKVIKTEAPKQGLARSISSKIGLSNSTPPPFIDKSDFFKTTNKNVLPELSVSKPAINKPDVVAIRKKITLPPVDMDKINNASYINYYQLVREKIRRAAYQNYSRTDTGEVYLSFIIANDGELKETRIVEDKSSSNPYLRETALRSIKEASLFPSFPKELNYSNLSFTVAISFEIE